MILGLPYSMSIDMWSLGCILGEVKFKFLPNTFFRAKAELYTGLPIFPGENEHEQMACIMEIFGIPSDQLLERASRRKVFFDSKNQPRSIVNSRGKKRKPATKSLGYMLGSEDKDFLHFLNQCFE